MCARVPMDIEGLGEPISSASKAVLATGRKIFYPVPAFHLATTFNDSHLFPESKVTFLARFHKISRVSFSCKGFAHGIFQDLKLILITVPPFPQHRVEKVG